jgi:hypothetical protein
MFHMLTSLHLKPDVQIDPFRSAYHVAALQDECRNAFNGKAESE